MCWAWWVRPVIPALERPRGKDQELEGSLSYLSQKSKDGKQREKNRPFIKWVESLASHLGKQKKAMSCTDRQINSIFKHIFK